MRRRILASLGWKNPYVTDGLIAMWDGEWNAGGGRHDSSADKWAEIVGNRPTSQDGLIFNDQCVTFSGNSSWLIDSDSTDILQALRSDGFTLEFILSPTSHSTGSSNNVYVNIGEDSSPRGFMIWDNSIYAFSGYSLLVSNTGFKGLNTIPWSSYSKRIDSVILRKSGTRTSLKAFGLNTTSTNNYQIKTGNFTIGNLATKANGINGDVYCIRIYSRYLTDTELAHNRAIDKARFNLPDAA